MVSWDCMEKVESHRKTISELEEYINKNCEEKITITYDYSSGCCKILYYDLSKKIREMMAE
jgi:hypothetical protein